VPLELILEERGAPPRTQRVAADTAFVGRREDCEVVLPYSFVSARHARIQVRSGTVFVEDLGSTNGVSVNGEALAPLVPRALSPDDVVRIEKIALRARSVGAPALAPEPTFHEVRVPVRTTSPAPRPLPAEEAPGPSLAPPPAPPAPPLPAEAAPGPPFASSLPPPSAPARLPERDASLGEALQASRATAAPRRPPAPAGPGRLAARLAGEGRFFVASLVFRGIGLLAVLAGFALLLLVLLA
jgi:predicted component of type VI protein secretion system